VITNNGIGEVGVQTHTGGQTKRKVSENAHQERGDDGSSSSGSNKIELDVVHAVHVVGIIVASGISSGACADTRTTGVTDDASVDRNNVSLVNYMRWLTTIRGRWAFPSYFSNSLTMAKKL
jgi:hypothetical protein